MLVGAVYREIKFDYFVKFSDRPPMRIGSDAVWDQAEGALNYASMVSVLDPNLNPGEGAFFFFQAEDGIRDGHVTGVQTCALPIWVFWPLALPVLVVLGLLLAVMAGLVQVGTLVYAYERIGIDRSWLLALLGLSIVGSAVNLPVARLRSSVVLGPQVIRVYGIRYLVPAVRTLVGADLLNLPRIRKLGAPVASIGGAGTFDGIFLSGLLAVLIASI